MVFSLPTTSTSDAFADDTTFCTLATRDSFTHLKTTLADFGNLSGLKCNLGKTSVMIVGNNGVVPADLTDLEFTFVNNFTLLGMKIDSSLECLNTVHEDTIVKTRKIANFWKRFNLSLPGRLGIAKTLLLSQISYTGCIISPTRGQFSTLKDIVYGFIKGSLNISKERITLPTKEGGLGMIDLEDFIIAQQTTWVKLAYLSGRDNWRYDINRMSSGNCLSGSTDNIDSLRHPVIFGIFKSFVHFREIFNSTNDNLFNSFVINNPLVRHSREDHRKLTLCFFNQTPSIPNVRIANLKFSDVCNRDGMKTLWDINNSTNLGLNLLTFMRLGTACTNTLNCTRNNRVNNNHTSVAISNFLTNFKKGSKPIRNVLTRKKIGNKCILNRPSTVTFFRLIDLPFPEKNLIEELFAEWNTFSLPNKLREFMFKFVGNILGLNTRIAHFVDNPDRLCTFCRNSEESFVHLFFECRTTDRWLREFETTFYPEILLVTPILRRQFWFLHILPAHNGFRNSFISFSLWIFKFLIWEAKLQKRQPSFTSMKIDYFYYLGNLKNCNTRVRADFAKITYAICRNWGRWRGGP